MKGKLIIMVLFASFMFLGLIILAKPMLQDKPETEIYVTTPNIIFRYGVSGAKHPNELNTFEGIFTRDMVSKAPVSTRLDLTQEEMDTIYEKMVDIKFFSYPEAFQPKLSDFITESTPFMVYYLEYRDGDQIKIVRWNTKYVVPEDMKYQELQDLANLIIDMIEDKPEYQKLHEPYGGYA